LQLLWLGSGHLARLGDSVESNDVTNQLLRDIREGVTGTNTRLDQTIVRLDQTIVRLDQMDSRLERTEDRGEQTNVRLDSVIGRLDHLYAGHIKLSTEVNAMGGTLSDVKTLLVGRRDLRHRIDRCEREIVELKKHIGK
jgi:hypothetical protein